MLEVSHINLNITHTHTHKHTHTHMKTTRARESCKLITKRKADIIPYYILYFLLR